MNKPVVFTISSIIVAATAAYFGGLLSFGKKVVMEQSIQIVPSSDKFDTGIVGQVASFLSSFAKTNISIPKSLTININITVKNPSKTTVTLSHPFVEMRFKKDAPSPFASSTQINKTYIIKALETHQLDTISIPNISVSTLALTALDLIKQFISTKKIEVFIKSTVYVDGLLQVKEDTQTLAI